jgi:DNA-directed RNA polymerase specialized sigma24 family protein
MRNEDDLRDTLTEAAGAIADFSGNPRTWLSWIIVFMEQLEKYAKSTDPVYQELYQDLLPALQDAVRSRIRNGIW